MLAMKELSTIGKRLEYAREQAGYDSASAFCKAFGFKYQAYRSHERGNRIPEPETVRDYAEKLKLSRDWLMFGSGTMAADIKYEQPAQTGGMSDAPYTGRRQQEPTHRSVVDEVSDFLDAYRKLSPAARSAAFQVLRAELLADLTADEARNAIKSGGASHGMASDDLSAKGHERKR